MIKCKICKDKEELNIEKKCNIININENIPIEVKTKIRVSNRTNANF